MSMSESDFIAAIQKLHNVWNSASDLDGAKWQSVEIVKTREINAVPYMNITKLIPYQSPQLSAPSSPTQDQEPEEDEDEDVAAELLEHDPESLPPRKRTTTNPRAPIIYTLYHSPTYLVPILYIMPPSSSTTSRPISLPELSTLIIPPIYVPSLRNPSIGPLGALSPTTHPETGRSCLWIHPCLTQEGMDGLGLEGNDGVRYLLGWMGMVGPGVGLEVPVEIARELLSESEGRG